PDQIAALFGDLLCLLQQRQRPPQIKEPLRRDSRQAVERGTFARHPAGRASQHQEFLINGARLGPIADEFIRSTKLEVELIDLCGWRLEPGDSYNFTSLQSPISSPDQRARLLIMGD